MRRPYALSAVLVLLAVAVVAAKPAANANTGFFPPEVYALMGDTFANPPSCFDPVTFQELLSSADMIDRVVELPALAIPYQTLAQYLMVPPLFPTWDSDYTAVANTQFAVCQALDANFTTRINATFPSGSIFAKPMIVLVNGTAGNDGFGEQAFGWTFVLLANDSSTVIYYGAHFYYLATPVMNGVVRPDLTRFVSWQKIYGGMVSANSAAFESGLSGTVQLPDMRGVNCLERVYLNAIVNSGGTPPEFLDPAVVSAACAAAPASAAASHRSLGGTVVPH